MLRNVWVMEGVVMKTSLKVVLKNNNIGDLIKRQYASSLYKVVNESVVVGFHQYIRLKTVKLVL